MTAPHRPYLHTHRYALAAACVYLVFGVAWILGSDHVIATVSDDMAVLSRLQSAKGSLFVLLSALAMYFVVRLHADADDTPTLSSTEIGRVRPRLRLQLLLLIGATTLPLIALLAFNVHREARRDVETAGAAAQNLARLIATDAARIVRDTGAIAERLAQRPDVRTLDADRCDPQLAEVTRLLPYVANAVTVRRDGEVMCTAMPLPGSRVNFAQAPMLERVVQSGRSTVGRLQRGPISGRWVVPVAAVLRDADGRIDGMIVMTIDVVRLPPLGQAPAGAASFITLIDGRGNVLMRVPEDGRVGANEAESDIVRTALRDGDGRGRARGLKGDDQIFGFARVDGSEWLAIASVPASTALAASRESAARSSVLGTLILLITGLLAYIAGRRVERPMRAIAVAARSVAEGNLAARAPVAGSRETAEVAAQLNRLLERLPRIESKLRESEKRLSLVLGAAQEGIVVSDAEQQITYANHAAARLLGVRETSELVGRRLADVMRDSTPDDPLNRLSEERPGRADRYEFRLRAHDGIERWLFISATPLRSDAGGVEGTLAMLYDVTERKDVEERLARVTRLYWALSEVNEAIVRTTDRATLFAETCRVVVEEGGFVTAFVALLDDARRILTPAASTGPTFGTIGVDPISIVEGAPFAGGPLATAVRTGQPEVVNDFFVDDRTLPARPFAEQVGIRSFAAFPLRCEGRVVGALAVHAAGVDYFDIGLTELLRQVADDVSFALDVYERAAARDRAEASVRELNTDLERRVAERTARLTEANQELESFSYSVSHDLRAPVRAINGFAQLLATQAGGALDEEGARLLRNIIRASAHMGRLIDDLLTFAQLGRSAIDLRPVALSPLVERIVEQMRPLIDGCGAQVSVAPLPQVLGEPTLLHQVFSNLLGNAVEYRRPDVAPRIDVSWRDAGERVEVAVSDNGIGIAPEHQAQIFEMFVRLHPASAHPGTGIGLALVAKAVALMQGEVTVESTADEGATFRVVLPSA